MDHQALTKPSVCNMDHQALTKPSVCNMDHQALTKPSVHNVDHLSSGAGQRLLLYDTDQVEMIHQQGLSKNGAACPARTCRGGTGPQQSCMKPLETHRHMSQYKNIKSCKGNKQAQSSGGKGGGGSRFKIHRGFISVSATVVFLSRV